MTKCSVLRAAEGLHKPFRSGCAIFPPIVQVEPRTEAAQSAHPRRRKRRPTTCTLSRCWVCSTTTPATKDRALSRTNRTFDKLIRDICEISWHIYASLFQKPAFGYGSTSTERNRQLVYGIPGLRARVGYTTSTCSTTTRLVIGTAVTTMDPRGGYLGRAGNSESSRGSCFPCKSGNGFSLVSPPRAVWYKLILSKRRRRMLH